MASEMDRLFNPEQLRDRWSAAPAPVEVGAVTSPALVLLRQLEQEAEQELGALGPALQLLFGQVREQLTAEATSEDTVGPLLDQIEDLLEARVRW